MTVDVLYHSVDGRKLHMAVLTLTPLATEAKEHMIQNQHLVTFRLKSIHASFQKVERHFFR